MLYLLQIGGQCDCKRRVSGRQCLQCQDGFYDLQALDPDGCRPCNCNPSGTVDGDITCHQNSGQCSCKANVIGMYDAQVYSHISIPICGGKASI